MLIDSVNVLSHLHDAADAGMAMAPWEPVTWEATSGAGMLVACWIIYAALRLAPPSRTAWTRLALVHVSSALAFSGLHIALMTGMRIAVYAARGLHYRAPTLGDVIYEYRKDVLAYLVLGTLFWLFCRPAAATGEPPDARASDIGQEAMFDIRDGPRTLRTPVRAILAVRAAGNYIEFALEDGSRPLMRGSLSSVESALAAHGLVRTHRSWLVNATRLCRLEAVGSGDYRLGLPNGLDAPLSRRFPVALARLRAR